MQVDRLTDTPLMQWTPKKLRAEESLWVKALKYLWKLPVQTASAPFLSAAADGGLGHRSVEWHLAAEQQCPAPQISHGYKRNLHH